MNIDPNSKEGKKQKRLIRNRMSAQLHRERKREHLKQLEQQLAAKVRLEACCSLCVKWIVDIHDCVVVFVVVFRIRRNRRN